MLNVKLNVFCQKIIKALTNLDIAFLKKEFKFFFHDKKPEGWYISLKTFILRKQNFWQQYYVCKNFMNKPSENTILAIFSFEKRTEN